MPSKSFNLIVGHLGQDPKLTETKNGKFVVEFTVATNTPAYKDKESTVTWHSIKKWGEDARWISENLNKGDLVVVTGRNATDSWEQDGKMVYKTYILADTVIKGQTYKKPAADDPGVPF